jgi:hypothetical protein
MTQYGSGNGDSESEMHCFHLDNVSGATGNASCTLTNNSDAGDPLNCHYVVIQNAQSTPTDVTVNNVADSSTTSSLASGTLSQANEVVVTMVVWRSSGCGGFNSWINSFTALNACTDNGGGIALQDAGLVVSSTASVTPSISLTTGTGDWTMYVVSFKH